VAKLSSDGLYRVTYGETPGYTLDEMRARLPLKLELMLPGHPRPGDYDLVNMAPYKIHRMISTFLFLFSRVSVVVAVLPLHLCYILINVLIWRLQSAVPRLSGEVGFCLPVMPPTYAIRGAGWV
jgi:hypothetical protein